MSYVFFFKSKTRQLLSYVIDASQKLCLKSLVSFSNFSFVIKTERHKGVIIQSGVS